MIVKYIGEASVAKPTVTDILNISIDECLASKNQIRRLSMSNDCGTTQDYFIVA